MRLVRSEKPEHASLIFTAFQKLKSPVPTAQQQLLPLARAGSSQVTRISFLAVPATAILVMAIVVFRHFRRVDEFLRRLMVECFASAGAFTLAWTLVYGAFEIAGLPKISTWWTFGGGFGLESLDIAGSPAMKNRVRELREARGWTQVYFGNQLNVSRQTVYAIESGLYDPSLPSALAIGKLFGCIVEEIFGVGSRDVGPAKNHPSGKNAKPK